MCSSLYTSADDPILTRVWAIQMPLKSPNGLGWKKNGSHDFLFV